MQDGYIEKIEKEIEEKQNKINQISEELKKGKREIKLEIIEKLKGIKRTTGQHPGGLLISLPEVEIEKYTPLNYPAENRQSE